MSKITITQAKTLRVPTPIWLTDTEYPAPCVCGQPMMPGESFVLAEGDGGLRRLMHVQCAMGYGYGGYDVMQ